MTLNGTEIDFVRENVLHKGNIAIKDAVVFILLSRLAHGVVDERIDVDKLDPQDFADTAKEITGDIQTLFARL